MSGSSSGRHSAAVPEVKGMTEYLHDQAGGPTNASIAAGTDVRGSAIRVEELSKSYHTAAGEVHALREVSFEIPAGSITVLTGRSGSGKTTLLNCVGGLDVPTSGRVMVGETEVTALDEPGRTALRREQISFVFQTFGLVPMLSATENVGLPLRLRRMDPGEREDRV
ncbi:MAG: hypothetical protein RI885_2424, partial [Actinomycetota bacterium]